MTIIKKRNPKQEKKRKQIITNSGEYVGKGYIFFTTGENISYSSHYGNQYRGSTKN
jgi:hypothetical protein